MILPVKKTQNWLPGILNDFLGNEWIAKVNATAPAINILETDMDYQVEIAAPGISKDDFKIKVDGDQLIVSMEKKAKPEPKSDSKVDAKVELKPQEKNERYLRREFSFAQFQQTMILPENVDKNKISAQQENGVLTITIPKIECSADDKSKVITVK